MKCEFYLVKIWIFGLFLVGGGGLNVGLKPAWPAPVLFQPGEDNQNESPSTKPPSGPIPFGGYEERLRESSQWKRMSPEQRKEAIQKIRRLRDQFQKRQERLEAQYKNYLEKSTKRRESLIEKRRRAQTYKKVDHWKQFQALPIKKRLRWEKKLGLNLVVPSQRKKKFTQRLERLPYSTRQNILRDLAGNTP